MTKKRARPAGGFGQDLVSQDPGNLAQLGAFCRKMGREANQGEVGLVIADEYFGIRDFAKE